MARKVRVQYPGAIYHVINRGDRREPIFRDDQDRELFLRTLGESCAKTGWQVHAYCLMSNHFHLVIETPQANLVAGMKWFLGTYTSRFNRRHKLFGHLFSGRYKALIVDGSGNGYLRTVCDYVHLNPVRAKLLSPEQPLRDYQWSSYRHYRCPTAQRPVWARVDRMLGELGIPKDSAAGRRMFETMTEDRRQRDNPHDYTKIRRGWCLGDEEFRKELLEQMRPICAPHHGGQEKQETEESKAQRLLAQELKCHGLKANGLDLLPKGNATKVKVARALRSQTTMTWAWIAQALAMGSGGHAANCVRKYQG